MHRTMYFALPVHHYRNFSIILNGFNLVLNFTDWTSAAVSKKYTRKLYPQNKKLERYKLRFPYPSTYKLD